VPFLLKVLLSAVVIAVVSELGKRFTLLAAILASLPLTSILALTWLWVDTRDEQPIIDLSVGIFWAVLPSLIFFLVLPVLLRAGLGFPAAMLLSCLVMAASYGIYALLLRQLGVQV
jgi:hypothetical protein